MTDPLLTASRRRRRRLVLVFVLLALLLAWVGLDVWAGHKAHAAFAALQKRYGPLDGHSMVAPSVPAVDNRALAVRAAALLTLPGNSDAELSASLRRFRNVSDASPVPDDIRAFVESNGEAIRLADLAISRTQSSWEADYGGGFNVPSWLVVRRLPELLYAAARIDIAAGNPDQALRRLAAGLAVSASVEQEPSLIAQLIRIASASDHFDGIKRLISTTEPSQEGLRLLAALLEDNRQPDAMQTALIAELRDTNGVLTRMEERPGSVNSRLPGMAVWGGMGLIGRPFVRLARVEYLRQMEELIALDAGPRPRPALQLPPARGWNPRRTSVLIAQGLLRAIDSGDGFKSALGTAQIGVALRRYRLDRHAYPDDLSALVPDYLRRLPIDPMTGRPPAYVRQGSGFSLRSLPVPAPRSVNSALDWDVRR